MLNGELVNLVLNVELVRLLLKGELFWMSDWAHVMSGWARLCKSSSTWCLNVELVNLVFECRARPPIVEGRALLDERLGSCNERLGSSL